MIGDVDCQLNIQQVSEELVFGTYIVNLVTL